MGQAVAWPDGDRQKPIPPTKNDSGGTTHHGNFFWGLTANQRIEVILEALRFKLGPGKNPVVEGHRLLKISERVGAIEGLRKTKGSSLQAALDAYDFPEYRGENGARKYYKDRQKLTDG